MKKIFLAAIMLVAAYTLYAQQTTVTYQATSTTVPVEIRSHFEANNPGVTVISWEPMTDYWYVTYKGNNNRLVHTYYSTQIWYTFDMSRNGNYIVALPVLNSFVPESVITSAIDKYGNNLYSITAMKGTAGAEGNYVVTIIKNGVSDRVMLNGEGVVMNNRQM